LKLSIIGFFGILFATFTISATEGIKNNNFKNKNKIFLGIIKL
jgi:hypothetical protein